MDQRNNHHLGVNKFGKQIRKSPIHQPNYNSAPPLHPPPPQPQVYNISKNDFRSVVQQLTGTPSRDPTSSTNSDVNSSATRPPHPKPSSMRLQRIRPPPLTPIARPPIPNPAPNFRPNYNHNPSSSHVAVSPVTAYMKYLESSLLYSDGTRPPPLPTPGLLPTPRNPNFSHNQQMGLLPSPNAGQFMQPPHSPSSFLNLMSPKSPYPLLSPGFQYPPPLSPNFMFSPGILGPGPYPQSPSLMFPQSPSGFFPILSPRWRDL